MRNTRNGRRSKTALAVLAVLVSLGIFVPAPADAAPRIDLGNAVEDIIPWWWERGPYLNLTPKVDQAYCSGGEIEARVADLFEPVGSHTVTVFVITPSGSSYHTAVHTHDDWYFLTAPDDMVHFLVRAVDDGGARSPWVFGDMEYC